MPRIYKIRPVNERFWEKVNKESSQVFFEGTRCWEWQAFSNRGYGRFKAFGRMHIAPRFSYEIEFGEIPDGLWVLHKCDNPSCVNPKHLFLGTNQENTNDRHSKGRSAKGEGNGNSILSEQQVVRIRYLRKSGKATLLSLSKKYKVSVTTIKNIVYRKQWKWLE